MKEKVNKMAKILIYGDVHWSDYSSIIRSRGDKYSKRLENLINSVSWAEGLADRKNCDQIICLGDFFDTTSLNSEEATALQDVQWNLKIPHYFLVGNHESTASSLVYSSTKVLEAFGFHVVSSVMGISYHDDNFGLLMLPYILEENRKPLTHYIDLIRDKKRVVVSHNDLKGVNYGFYTSTEGFDLSEIENNCDLFINGHIHNGMFLNDKESILNLGIFTGQNFNEDASKYSHYVCILDTETLQLEFFENPYAFNFYKLDIDKQDDLNKLTKLKNNAVVTLRCEDKLVMSAREMIARLDNIVEHRLISYRDSTGDVVNDDAKLDLQVKDHLQQFYTFILDNVDYSVVSLEVLKEELNKVVM